MCRPLLEFSLLVITAGLAYGADGVSIRLAEHSAGKTIDVIGLSADDLAAIKKLDWKADQWPKLFAVYVVPANGKQSKEPLLGSYRVDNGMLRFEPRFPLTRGVRYRAVVDLARIPTRAALKEKPVETEILLPKPKT